MSKFNKVWELVDQTQPTSQEKTNGNYMNAWCKLGNFLANKRNGLLCIDFEQRSFHLLSLKTDDYDPHNDINR
ncbi:hypothetical protein DERP_009945 [Dermatophagoides pteronyssinus]|uniref:Uncharacterized protein n=1 Tax=Dermatophagoides pteronyssinus TaxID=6956 RepID=A0ABQ8J241_DERPT|nr:hypothetical protein DERP_009945 [Dermatophagoides pteronyssinus]